MTTEWTWTEFHKKLQKGLMQPVYFFYGDEPYLLDDALMSLLDSVVDKKLRSFNLNTFYAESASVLQIKEAVKTVPVGSDKKMVILKEASCFKQIDQLQSLIEKPTSSCVLVFVGDKINKQRKFFKTLSQRGAIVNCSGLKDHQLVLWIQKIASRFQKSIDDSGFLLQRVGPSMLDLHNEIIKLAEYVGERSSITAEDIKNVVPRHYMESVFDLVNALGSSKSLFFLRSLFHQGQNEIFILTMLSRQIRILILVKEAQSERLSPKQICQRAGIPLYFLNQYVKQGQSWSFIQLCKFHELLLETDCLLKSASISKSLLIENCILKASQIKNQQPFV